MEYKNLGRSGLKVSRLSFGSWVTFGHQIQDNTAEDLMKIAYDNGINFFDNAEVYAHGKSEIVMGNILKKMGWGRDTFVVSSKVYWGGERPNQYGLSRKHIFEACEAALKRLQVDYLDLYFCHRPDRETPIEETVFAMNDLIRMGKVMYWGTSEWDAQRITEAFMVARQYNLIPPVMEQPQYNMFHRQRFEVEYRQLFNQFGYGTTIWSPLASGLLTGKYNNGVPEHTRIDLPDLAWLREKILGDEGKKNLEKVRKLQNIADDLGMTLPHLGLSWCLKNPNVSTVILGASKTEQLVENLKALEQSKKLTDDVLQVIELVLDNKPEFPAFG